MKTKKDMDNKREAVDEYAVPYKQNACILFKYIAY